ncbi:uncharacterized protein CTRU02_210056 [Colletotrichum truncatum]|uniref:Uncharacterized protein n=1 Tax=Colletotrichum truncatum TaxID=5467 RepID=A0ACC3YU67_COLTU
METTNATIFRVDSPTLEAQSSSPRRGTIGESLDLEESSINPVLINNNLRALEQTLTETSDLTAKSRTYPDYATKIYTSCQDLTLQVNELLPILGEYADQWERPSTAARDIPLDPSLQLWIASLTRILSELGKIHKALDSAGDRTKDIELENSFATYVDALSDHYRQMNDFLPIMQIDFNDYKTKYMSFPSPTIAERITGPRHNYQVSNMGTDQIYCIRRAVYALKDELQRTILVLEASLSCLSDIRLIAVTDVITAVRRVFDAVSQALTNNGSEWIENDLKHGNRQLLSYAEFSNLDPTTIEDFTARIKQINDLVHIGALESRLWSAYMVQQHHICMLFEQQQLDSLDTIVSVLEEIMLPNQINTRTELDDFLKEI